MIPQGARLFITHEAVYTSCSGIFTPLAVSKVGPIDRYTMVLIGKVRASYM